MGQIRPFSADFRGFRSNFVVFLGFLLGFCADSYCKMVAAYLEHRAKPHDSFLQNARTLFGLL